MFVFQRFLDIFSTHWQVFDGFSMFSNFKCWNFNTISTSKFQHFVKVEKMLKSKHRSILVSFPVLFQRQKMLKFHCNINVDISMSFDLFSMMQKCCNCVEISMLIFQCRLELTYQRSHIGHRRSVENQMLKNWCQVTSKNWLPTGNAWCIGAYIPEEVLEEFDLDRDVPPKPQNPYPFLRAIFAKKRYPFLRIFLII